MSCRDNSDSEPADVFSMPCSDPGNILSFDFHGLNFMQRDRASLCSPEHSFLGVQYKCVVKPFCSCRYSYCNEVNLCTYMSVAIQPVNSPPIGDADAAADAPPLSGESESEEDERAGVELTAAEPVVVECSLIHPDAASKRRLSLVGSSAQAKRPVRWRHFARRCDLRSGGYIGDDGSLVIRVRIVSQADAVRSPPPVFCGRGSLLCLLEDPVQSHADVKLCGEEEDAAVVHAHKAVLCTVSSFFSGLLAGGFKESSQELVRMQGVSSAALVIVVRHLYGDDLPGSLCADLDLLLELWRFAAVSLLTHVKAAAETMLLSLVGPPGPAGSAGRHDLRDDEFIAVLQTAMALESRPLLSELAWSVHSDFLGSRNIAALKELADENLIVTSILDLTPEAFAVFLHELPVLLSTYHLIECWLDADEERLDSAEALFSAFAIQDLPKSELKQTEMYGLAAKYASRRSLFAVAQKLAYSSGETSDNDSLSSISLPITAGELADLAL